MLMNEEKDMSELFWETGWDGHEKAQRLRMSRLSLIEKIKWLEDAQEVINRLQGQKGMAKVQ
jgi:hypothetical protein